jgi:hypothetical protein
MQHCHAIAAMHTMQSTHILVAKFAGTPSSLNRVRSAICAFRSEEHGSNWQPPQPELPDGPTGFKAISSKDTDDPNMAWVTSQQLQQFWDQQQEVRNEQGVVVKMKGRGASCCVWMLQHMQAA